MAEKQFGLIKPQKPSTRLTAFASDSDSEGEPTKKRIATDASSSQRRQARILQEDALKEDPTIFQYDEVYDDINATREEAKKAKSTEVRESKYISRLLVTAEKRKLEHETRLERKVQKEREAEGDMYKDKEVFVTASYRAKLEAMKKAEEEAKREEYLENIGDVRKQKDLSGFYRHMYEQKLGGEKTESKENEETKPELEPIKKDDKSSAKRRAYRKHDEHESDDDEPTTVIKNKDESAASKKVHLQSNLDADSDFSIDSSDSETEDKKPVEKETTQTGENEEAKEEKKDDEESKKSTEEKPTESDTKEENGEKQKNGGQSDAEKMPPPQPKPKIDVWKKRTVGDAYFAAVQRYHERKQSATA